MCHGVAASIVVRQQLHLRGGESADLGVDQCTRHGLGVARGEPQRTDAGGVTVRAHADYDRGTGPCPSAPPHRPTPAPGRSWTRIPAWTVMDTPNLEIRAGASFMRIFYTGRQPGSWCSRLPPGLESGGSRRPIHLDPDIIGITGNTTCDGCAAS